MNATQAIDRLRQAIRRQHKAFSTEDSYVFWLRRYLKALSAMNPQPSSEKKVEAFLTQLAREGLSASSQNQAFNYPTNLISRMLYGCGLRVTEPLNLRIKDVDLERRTLCIRGAKGGNDRVFVLPKIRDQSFGWNY